MSRVLVVCIVIFLTAVSAALAQDECAPQQGCMAAAYGLPEADILAFPAPKLERLLPNDYQLYSHGYRRILGAVDIYDAPNGSVIASRPQGNHYVSIVNEQDGWTQINPGQWVRSEFVAAAPISRLGGVFLNQPMPYPVGWIRRNFVPSPIPGASPQPGALALVSYTLVNVYAEANFGGQRWFQVGVNQWVEQSQVAVIRPIERPAEVDTVRWVGVDLAQQVAIAYEGTTPVFAALVATGLPESPTQEGLFHIYVRFHRTLMRSDTSSPFYYYVEDVPYTMYFNGNQAIHGTYWHDRFGHPRSHGCVNFTMTDAYWMYGWLSQEIDTESEDAVWPAVYVYSS